MRETSQKGFAAVLWIFFILLLLVFGVFSEPYIADYVASGTFGNPEKPVEIKGDTISASGVYAVSGHSITVFLQFSKNGGGLSGTVSGDCSGTVTGSYAGEPTGLIEATGRGTCSLGILKVPGMGEFSGTVMTKSGIIELNLSGRALKFTHNGHMILNFE